MQGESWSEVRFPAEKLESWLEVPVAFGKYPEVWLDDMVLEVVEG